VGEHLTCGPQVIGPLCIEELDKDSTEYEVKKYVTSMKNNKAVGFDGMSAEMWKMFSTMNDGIKMLKRLFNKIRCKR
jgi:hypothetical protein